MFYTSKIKDAIRFATKTHEVYQQQKRKGKNIAYITHPLTVGLILSLIEADEDVVVAGILHDTIEDSIPEKKVTPEMLAERFGKKVADLVVSVTESDKNLPWADRKKAALEHIKTFSNESLLVKSADVISNARELIDDYKIEGDKTFKRFNAPKEKVAGNYCKVIEAILDRWCSNPLRSDLEDIKAEMSESLCYGPFIGWIKFPEGHKEPYGESAVYLINPTDDHYQDIEIFSGMFQSDDAGTLESSKYTKKYPELKPHSAIRMDSLGWYDLDFVIWYHLDFFSGNDMKRDCYWFEITRARAWREDKLQFIDVLNTNGMRINLLYRRDDIPISEEVKMISMEAKYTPRS